MVTKVVDKMECSEARDVLVKAICTKVVGIGREVGARAILEINKGTRSSITRVEAVGVHVVFLLLLELIILVGGPTEVEVEA